MINNSTLISKYRLYYNSDGTPRYYTMEDLSGDYIFVDLETFACGRYDVIVKDKKLYRLSDIESYPKFVKIEYKTETSIMTDSSDITLVTENESNENNLWDYTKSS